jgi:hypothetical protein
LLKDDAKVSISVINNNFITGHYNAADLPMLSDFDEIKDQLSIVAKSFVTLRKPIRFEESFVFVRDTMLLAPGGMKGLANLAKLYENEGDFSKRKISRENITQMSKFLVNDRDAFIEYAINDSKITLKHAVEMEKFNKSVQQIGIPVTLSSIGRNYISTKWCQNFEKHLPYQISGEYLMGNADEIQTPKGLFSTREVGIHMSYFIANYKGGRNESFMYGCDDKTY